MCSNEKDIQDNAAALTIACWSVDKYSTDSLLGQVVVPLSSLAPNVPTKQWFPLAARGEEKVKGKIFLEILMITDTVRRAGHISGVFAGSPLNQVFLQSVLSKKKSAPGKKMKRKLSLGDDDKAPSSPKPAAAGEVR
jgi:Ca2+-dependent lipid-binding protein